MASFFYWCAAPSFVARACRWRFGRWCPNRAQRLGARWSSSALEEDNNFQQAGKNLPLTNPHPVQIHLPPPPCPF